MKAMKPRSGRTFAAGADRPAKRIPPLDRRRSPARRVQSSSVPFGASKSAKIEIRRGAGRGQLRGVRSFTSSPSICSLSGNRLDRATGPRCLVGLSGRLWPRSRFMGESRARPAQICVEDREADIGPFLRTQLALRTSWATGAISVRQPLTTPRYRHARALCTEENRPRSPGHEGETR